MTEEEKSQWLYIQPWKHIAQACTRLGFDVVVVVSDIPPKMLEEDNTLAFWVGEEGVGVLFVELEDVEEWELRVRESDNALFRDPVV